MSIRAIGAETVRAVCALSVAPAQQHLVAPNAVSLAQALFAPDAWYRALCLDDTPVGFVMLRDSTLRPAPTEPPTIELWRFMVDARFQGRGIGRAALSQVFEQLRARRLFTKIGTSYVPGPGGPEAFYLGLGFEHTGRVNKGEIVLERPLA